MKRENSVERQARKRREAEERNARTPHDRTKAHRLGRCSCATPESRPLTPVFGKSA